MFIDKSFYACYFFYFIFVVSFSKNLKAVAAEKNHQNLLTGVEHFDKSSMKHTETSEKNALPPIEGLFAVILLY